MSRSCRSRPRALAGHPEQGTDQLLHSPEILRRLAVDISEAEMPGVVAAVLAGVIAVAAFAHVVAGGLPRVLRTSRQGSRHDHQTVHR